MEATTGVVASHGGSLPVPLLRKEWRAVSDHHSVQNGVNEELKRPNVGQSDERTIYEVQHGREPVDVDFCSITVDGSSDNDILQQRISSITRQREELQQIEIELKAQEIAKSEINEIRNSFNAQIKNYEDAASKLQEKLCEYQQTIHDLERRIEEKDRELHAIKLDNEAAWAKEGLLREQNKELATYRRERDHSEAERVQHIQQLRDLQEHIQEKDRQILELQEQHRADQETIYMKEEQVKVWIARVQEMDTLQSTTNHSLQVELRDRTEQYNQLWLGFQRQFAEMERLHLHTIQQLHFELADARERSGSYPEESRLSQNSSKDSSKFGQHNGNQQDVNGSAATNANIGVLSNGNADNIPNQTNHVAGVPIGPSSLLGMPTYLPSGMHPFILHQQGTPHSVPSHVSQTHVGSFHPLPAMSSILQWKNQQAASEGAELSPEHELVSCEPDKSLIREDTKYEYEMSVNRQVFPQGYMEVHMKSGTEPDFAISSSTGEAQAFKSMDTSYLVSSQSDQNIQHMSSQLNDSLRLDHLDENNDTKEPSVINHDAQGLTEQPNSSSGAASAHSVNLIEATVNNGGAPADQTNVPTVKIPEIPLLDERSLLACIVRTIPSGGRIHIKSTLPNRLVKMLAPLHWHDYKKKYGKLDDFVAGHPELFVIEGEYIQLREGAQEMIAATAAAAKVAAAAAKPASSYSSTLPSVAVTPMSQSHRLKHSNGLSYSKKQLGRKVEQH